MKITDEMVDAVLKTTDAQFACLWRKEVEIVIAAVAPLIIAEVLADFERRTEAVPVGSENISIGASVYGWRIRHLDELREIAASLARPVSEREDEQ